ncbi:hypothetical protein [Lewinella sp. 4G2]|uniref:hypothetical protein n=1 Tax=Lewinella sp. 4G2 TaxID=1803372 RepID=UPI0007B48714|nr:hypothetical protein [Lewinella sp. 4G2]OAV42573.1 hypothetical protein A3850_015100 [Lewinella sp. 4G2]
MRYFYFSFLLLLCTRVSAQCPPDFTIVLENQDAVDLHVALYPNCTELGNLTLGGAANDITDISGFSALEEIDFTLRIEGTLLTDLSGLEGINSLRTLQIEDNSALTNLNQFGDDQTIIFNTLIIQDNSVLTDCAVTAVCNQLSSNGSTTISNNTGDCASTQLVQDACLDDCPAQTQFLLDLYAALDGPNWSNQTGWGNPTCDPCGWAGLDCDGDGNVTEIFLEGRTIGGVLPATGWTALPELQLFRLSVTNTEGAVPDEIYELPKLREINLAFTRLTSLPDLPLPDSLRVLRLNETRDLIGGFPDPAEADSLESYTVRNSGLTGELPSSLATRTKLSLFAHTPALFGAGASGTMFDLSGLPNIESVTISAPNITAWDNYPATLSNLPNLKSISINIGMTTPGIPAELTGLPELITFQYRSNQDGSPPFLADATKLRRYLMDRHNGTLTLPDTLKIYGGTGLEELDMSRAGISGCFPVFPPSLDNLEEVYFNDNNIRDTLGEQFNLSELDEVDISNNRFTGFLPEYVGNLNVFFSNSIRFNDNEFVGCYPDSYTNLASGSRRLADFSGNPALRDFNSFISNPNNACKCTNPDYETLLRIYYSTGFKDWTTATGFSSAGTVVTCNFDNWHGVTTDGNGLVTGLDLSNNNLSGELPVAVAEFTQLTTLDLSGNALMGCYPVGYADLCAINPDFSNNSGLPEGGSTTFFADRFCPDASDRCGGDCPTGDILFSSDAEIQDFLDFWPNCTEIEGNLTVSGVDVATGAGLDRFTDLPLDLTISGTTLSNLSSIGDLQTLGGTLLISGNEQLTDVGFTQISAVAGSVVFVDNEQLNSLQMPVLDSVGGDLILRDLPLLVSDYNFDNLFTIEGDLTIDNLGVTRLAGFQNLSTLGGQLGINDNDELTELALFTSTTARGSAAVGPTSVGELRVFGNAILPSLEGIGTFDITGDVLIGINAALENCAAEPVCNRLGVSTNDVTIVSNAAGCNDVPEVESACMALPVSWVAFTARAASKSVSLKWITEDEFDNLGFHIERRDDQSNWTDIGFVPSEGDPARAEYAFTDAAPLVGTAYYRLRQIDADGSFSHSPVETVRLAAATRLFPNPTYGRVTVAAEAPQTLVLLDGLGREMARYVHPGGGAQAFDLAVPAGVYTLSFMGSGVVERVVVR